MEAIMKKELEKQVMLSLKIPASVHRALRMKAAADGKTMSAVLVAALAAKGMK